MVRPTADQILVQVVPKASDDGRLQGLVVATGEGFITWDQEVEMPPLGSVVTFPARLRAFRCRFVRKGHEYIVLYASDARPLNHT